MITYFSNNQAVLRTAAHNGPKYLTFLVQPVYLICHCHVLPKVMERSDSVGIEGGVLARHLVNHQCVCHAGQAGHNAPIKRGKMNSL